MTYSTGNIILDDHYNLFLSGNADGTPTAGANVLHMWGVGNGDVGYGQSTAGLSAVTAGTTVTATQWSTLLSRMNTMASHQGTTLTAMTSPVAGDTISVINALNTNLTSIFNNRLNHAANATDITPTPATSTGTWQTERVHVLTCTFQSADAARYYFNAGGEIRISFNTSGGTANPKYNEWVDLTNNLAGTIVFDAQTTTRVGGTGTPTILASTIGYYDLTTNYQTIFRQFADSSPYTANFLEVNARYIGTLGANGDRSAQIQFEIRYRDDAVDTFSRTTSGTTTTNLVFRPPSVTHLTNVWSNTTAPSMTFTQTSA